MKEQDLIGLGFERVGLEETLRDEAFHYYTLDFGKRRGISLITPDSTSIKDDIWSVEIFEDESISYIDIEDVKDFIRVVKKGITNLKS
jgi:hypothetical protein